MIQRETADIFQKRLVEVSKSILPKQLGGNVENASRQELQESKAELQNLFEDVQSASNQSEAYKEKLTNMIQLLMILLKIKLGEFLGSGNNGSTEPQSGGSSSPGSSGCNGCGSGENSGTGASQQPARSNGSPSSPQRSSKERSNSPSAGNNGATESQKSNKNPSKKSNAKENGKAPKTTNKRSGKKPTDDRIYQQNHKRLKNAQLDLTKSHKKDLDKFKSHYDKHKGRYESVADKTNLPPELIASLHWRESHGDFGTYLHQGDPLGKPAVNIPNDIPTFHRWEDSAIHALGQKKNIQDKYKINKNTDDLAALTSYAERYNGTGYSNKGQASPYALSGTDAYHGGKYVSDGNYDPNAFDRNVGVAPMLMETMKTAQLYDMPSTPTSAGKALANVDTHTNRGGIPMKKGTLTLADSSGNVLGNYDFNNGGHGRGSIPAGEYVISNPRRRSDKSGMMRDGYGYSFNLSNKFDPRVGDTRSLLRIHPDGNSPGTMGCIGILGDKSVQQDFYTKLKRLVDENGGQYKLKLNA